VNILLTGGTGYIGSHAAVVMAGAGHRVVLLDNLSNSKALVVDRLRTIIGDDVPLVRADVRDVAAVTETLRAYRVDAVMHFAGLKSVEESFARPAEYFDNNLSGTIVLLRAMGAVGIKTLVFSSSATIYGVPKYLPIDEDHPLEPINPYGRSKLGVEHVLNAVATADPGWRIACLRYFNPAGAHASGLIGEDPGHVPNNLLPYIVAVGAGERPALQVFGDDYDTPDGTGVRDFIHVMDLAEGHAAALEFLRGRPGCHTFNLGTGAGHSVMEMIRAFESASGRHVPISMQGRRAGDVPSCYADAGKALRELGWRTNRSLGDIVDSAWRFSRRVGRPDGNLSSTSEITGPNEH